MRIVKTLRLNTEAQTQALAEQFANLAFIDNAFIALHGNLGTGKTCFARYLIAALGVVGRVKSPSYSVVESYQSDARHMNIWHFDFYRFNSSDEWEEAGFRDIFASTGLKLAEWPSKVPHLSASADLSMEFHLEADDARRLMLSAQTDKGIAMLQGVEC
jgi:tRNA threonylcarbamoyladenosine biosynthesis protein TsaE